MIQARERAPLASSPWKANPTRRYAPGRVCANEECTQVLAFDNPGPLCGPCQKAKETREFKAAQERAAASEAARAAKRVQEPKRGAKPQERKVMEVDGVVLKPATRPPRMARGTNWALVIKEFLASGEDCCEVALKNVNYKGVYSALQGALKGSHEAYASVRRGACYIVRIQK